MTKRECAIVMAYTGICMLAGDDFGVFYGYVSELMGRDLYTHELGLMAEEIKRRATPDFMALCRDAKEDSSLRSE